MFALSTELNFIDRSIKFVYCCVCVLRGSSVYMCLIIISTAIETNHLLLSSSKHINSGGEPVLNRGANKLCANLLLVCTRRRSSTFVAGKCVEKSLHWTNQLGVYYPQGWSKQRHPRDGHTARHPAQVKGEPTEPMPLLGHYLASCKG